MVPLLRDINVKAPKTTVEALFGPRLYVDMAIDDAIANWIFQEIAGDMVFGMVSDMEAEAEKPT